MLRTVLLLVLASAGPALAENSPKERYASWQGCLRAAYGTSAPLSSPALAADAALRACREAEGAYLAALATSPMLDGEDVTRVRPALIQKTRAWLIGRGARATAL